MCSKFLSIYKTIFKKYFKMAFGVRMLNPADDMWALAGQTQSQSCS